MDRIVTLERRGYFPDTPHRIAVLYSDLFMFLDTCNTRLPSMFARSTALENSFVRALVKHIPPVELRGAKITFFHPYVPDPSRKALSKGISKARVCFLWHGRA